MPPAESDPCEGVGKRGCAVVETTLIECPRCKVAKARAEFTNDKRRRDGRGAYCKPCSRAIRLAWVAANAGRVRAKNEQWAKANPTKRKAIAARHAKKERREDRDAAFAAYGGAFCARCGEASVQCLTIDHVNNDGAQHRKTFTPGKINRWLRLNNYPKGFQVLCRNCNWLKHANGGVMPARNVACEPFTFIA